MTSQSLKTGKKRSRETNRDVDDVKEINLSSQQEELISSIAKGKSVFITGYTSTGKSFLLRHAVSTLRHIHPSNSVFVTASTGVAACAVGGQTLFSFAGVGLGKGAKNELLSFVLKSNKAVDRWKRTKALVIDEISMIDGIRRGQVDRDNKNFQRFLLRTTSDNADIDENDNETRLFPRSDDVKRVKHERLKSLGGEVMRFNVVDKGSLPWLNQLKYLIAPDSLEICVGARVMLIKNTDQAIGLVNGVTSVVTGFKEVSCSSCENNFNDLVPIVLFDSRMKVTLEAEK